ncbi:uncharacterized protein [Argopecten irradians]|uniref:uncharacterized protein isoform X2 n=1 Tax=Argopecten irradians TaxID=31199 RepID=UPI003719FE99
MAFEYFGTSVSLTANILDLPKQSRVVCGDSEMAECTVPAHPIPRQTSVPVSGTLTISTASTVQEPQVHVSATLHVDPLLHKEPLAGTVVLNIGSMMSSGTATLDIRNTELSATATFKIEKGVVVSSTGNISLKYPGIKCTVPLFGTVTLKPGHLPCTATLDIRNMEHFMFFTHCTSIDNRESIQHMGYLSRNRTLDFWNEPLAGPNAPTGVWFAVTLQDGNLPIESPFGTERVLVPVEHIERHVQSSLKPVLYFKTQVDSEDSIYLFLLRGDDHAAINWCVEHNLEQLDIHNNQWLCFDMCGFDMRGLWITWANHPQSPLCWVYVFIADNVCIKGCDWDNVGCTRKC